MWLCVGNLWFNNTSPQNRETTGAPDKQPDRDLRGGRGRCAVRHDGSIAANCNHTHAGTRAHNDYVGQVPYNTATGRPRHQCRKITDNPAIS